MSPTRGLKYETQRTQHMLVGQSFRCSKAGLWQKCVAIRLHKGEHKEGKSVPLARSFESTRGLWLGTKSWKTGVLIRIIGSIVTKQRRKTLA